MYEKALRLGLRFPSPKGEATTEELFQLSLKELDETYRTLHKQLQEKKEVSLLAKPAKGIENLELMIEIVTDVVNKLQKEKEEKAITAERRKKKERIMSLINEKNDEALSAKSIEDLEAMLATL